MTSDIYGSRMRKDAVVELADWRRRISSLYATVRATEDAEDAWGLWKDARDELFGSHPQSPLPEAQRETFSGIDYFSYDPGLRVLGTVAEAEPKHYDIATSGDTTLGFTRFGVVTFGIDGRTCKLELYWLDGYGGGIFLPFKDSTSGRTTYGAGRYLLDTVKGADLGTEEGALVLDFNFAYNPSCSYDPRWVCPLSPRENRLEIAIEAGERFT
jgi:uncharacterized protein (DUF1684 family)